MRFNTFRFLVREGFRSLAKNWFMSMASVLVLVSCLLVTGCAYLVFENVNHGFDWMYQQNVMVAYTKMDATDEEAVAIQAALEKLDNVVAVEYRSKESLLEQYRDDLGDLLEGLEGDENPLSDMFVIRLGELAVLETTVKAVEAVPGVDEVDFDKSLSSLLVETRRAVFTVGSWVIVLLLVVSLFIIANTIKLTVYSRRLEISIMRSVGATHWFIRFPFMVEGLMLGFFAGVLGYGLTYGVYELIKYFFTRFPLISFGMVWWQLLIGFLVGGMLTGLVGSAISTTRYLRENKE